MAKPLNRRGLMQILGLTGLGALTATRAATTSESRTDTDWTAAPARDGTLKFAVDVAVLGHTDAPNTAGRIGPPQSHDFFHIDTRGDSFFVEGLLYPGGTIPAATVLTPMAAFPQAPPRLNNQLVWDFKAAKPMGHWLSRGWTLINGSKLPYTDASGTVLETARIEPHLLSEHNFMFSMLDSKNLSPEMLVTSGTENGNNPDTEVLIRAVTGGTGRFAHVTGQVVQTRLGRNTSNLRSFAGAAVKSPNYRFEFDLRVR